MAPFLLALTMGCTPDQAGDRPPDAAASPSAHATPSSAASASAVPVLTAEQEKAGQSILVNDCLACHAKELLEQQRLTPKQWAAVVKKMQGWGSLVEPSQVEPLVAFLSARYGLSASPFVPPTVDAARAADAIAPLPDGPLGGGDGKKGAATYKEACASCHGAGGHGSATGVTLADRPGLWRGAEFAVAVRTGRGRMPAFPTYTDADIASILAYLRSPHPG
jgi:mono/diheme cytochrome c family protein